MSFYAMFSRLEWSCLTLKLSLAEVIKTNNYFQSFAIPSFYAVWGKWAPSPERATLMNIAFCGQHVANALVFPLSALLCKYGFAGGWPSVFYVFGNALYTYNYIILIDECLMTCKKINFKKWKSLIVLFKTGFFLLL